MILAILLAMTLILALFMLGATWAMNAITTRLIGDRHRALETIFETGQVPDPWREPFQRRLARLGADPGHASQAAKLQREAKEHYLKSLDALTQYVQTSALVDGEDTRRILLAKLAQVRIGWQESESGHIQTPGISTDSGRL